MRTAFFFLLGIAGIAACEPPAPAIPVVEERYITPRDTADNVDSPAVWHGPDGQHWLLATAKATDVILAYDATDGREVARFGRPGVEAGAMERPNGIAIEGDLAIVVERDNARVQVFRLPEFTPVGMFGGDDLRLPYGVTVLPEGDSLRVFVTDNYEMPDESVPPPEQLGERVLEYRIHIAADSLASRRVRAFGATSGDGMLRIVESIAVDPATRTLLIAEEDLPTMLKEYTVDGAYTGRQVGAGLFAYQAEGIALLACGDAGYWFAADQDPENNRFFLFDRQSLAHVATFRGAVTGNTDGIALTQTPFGPFTRGAFFAVHDDGNVSAFALEDIAAAVGVDLACGRMR